MGLSWFSCSIDHRWSYMSPTHCVRTASFAAHWTVHQKASDSSSPIIFHCYHHRDPSERNDGMGKYVISNEKFWLRTMFSSCNRVKESKCVIPSFSQIDKLSPILLGTILKLFPIFFKQVCQTIQQLKYQPGHFDKMLISLHPKSSIFHTLSNHWQEGKDLFLQRDWWGPGDPKTSYPKFLNQFEKQAAW